MSLLPEPAQRLYVKGIHKMEVLVGKISTSIQKTTEAVQLGGGLCCCHLVGHF